MDFCIAYRKSTLTSVTDSTMFCMLKLIWSNL